MPQRPDALERGDHASHENTQHDQGTLYEVDSYTWALRQAGALRERRAAALDWDNLAEEVEDLAGRHRDALTSYLARVLQHLWKLKFWHALLKGNERIWRSEVDAYRERASRMIRRKPGLKGSLAEIVADGWSDARH